MAGTESKLGLLEGVALLTGFQLAGELLARMAGLPVPPAVLGMFLLFLWLLWLGRVPRGLQIAANGLLDNLALLFVPATVAGFLDLSAISSEAVAVVVAVVASTFLAMAVTAWTFQGLEHRRKEGR